MALIPEDQSKHHFSFEIVKVLKASGSGYGIVAVVALMLVVISLVVLVGIKGLSISFPPVGG